MTDQAPNWPRPAEYKTQADGRGGLVRAVLVGQPHDGRELFIDELELPPEIYTTGDPASFEWWPARLKDVMDRLPIGSGAASAPVRHVLRIPGDTREPQYVAEPAG
jgi:hypothetical protein